MITDLLPILATLAGIAMSASYAWQVYRIVQGRRSGDISLSLYTVLTLGMIVWLAYGISLDNNPMIITFVLGLIGTLSVVIVTLKYRKNKEVYKKK